MEDLCGAIVCGAASLNAESLVLHPPIEDERRPPPTLEEAKNEALTALGLVVFCIHAPAFVP